MRTAWLGLAPIECDLTTLTIQAYALEMEHGRGSLRGAGGDIRPPWKLAAPPPLRVPAIHTHNIHTCTVVSRKRAHYGLPAHPPVLPQFPAKV